MTPGLQHKLQRLYDRYVQVAEQLSDTNLASDIERLKKLSKEHADLRETAEAWQHYQHIQSQLRENEQLLQDDDSLLMELAAEEISC